jgi:hypothetical protein
MGQKEKRMAKEDEIRLIAYNIWEQEGCINGKDCEHWFRAEAIWEEQQKPFGENTNKESESPIPGVLVTPLPDRIELLSPPGRRNIREQHKKK